LSFIIPIQGIEPKSLQNIDQCRLVQLLTNETASIKFKKKINFVLRSKVGEFQKKRFVMKRAWQYYENTDETPFSVS